MQAGRFGTISEAGESACRMLEVIIPNVEEGDPSTAWIDAHRYPVGSAGRIEITAERPPSDENPTELKYVAMSAIVQILFESLDFARSAEPPLKPAPQLGIDLPLLRRCALSPGLIEVLRQLEDAAETIDIFLEGDEALNWDGGSAGVALADSVRESIAALERTTAFPGAFPGAELALGAVQKPGVELKHGLSLGRRRFGKIEFLVEHYSDETIGLRDELVDLMKEQSEIAGIPELRRSLAALCSKVAYANAAIVWRNAFTGLSWLQGAEAELASDVVRARLNGFCVEVRMNARGAVYWGGQAEYWAPVNRPESYLQGFHAALNLIAVIEAR